MKRSLDGIIEPEFDESPRCLPDWFLDHLEPYLSHSDLSSLARCCKLHMFLCYRRIAKHLQWGHHDFQFFMGAKLFPADAFLQMQLAKTILLTPRDAEPYFDLRQRKVPFPFTFEDYLTSICFSTPEEVLSRTTGRPVDLTHEAKAVMILNDDPYPKAILQAQLNNYALYRYHRSQSPYINSMLYEAMIGCSSLQSDTRIVLDELELSIKHSTSTFDNDADSEVFQYTEDFSHDPYMCLEHVDIFQRCMLHGLLCFENFAYDLLTNEHDGPARCRRMVRLGCFTVDEFTHALPYGFGSFLSNRDGLYDMHSPKGIGEFLHDRSYSLVPHVRNLLEWPPIRDFALQRLREVLPYAQAHVTDLQYQQLIQLAQQK